MLSEKLLLAFEGYSVPDYIADWLKREPLGGFTLFLPFNVKTAAQVRDLTAEIQAIAKQAGHPPLLIAIDQETGQLAALGDDTTQFAGNRALGVVDDIDLTHRVAQAVGRELLAVGVNVNYAPMADINTQPSNPACGIRAFGDEPGVVARHTAAFVEGLQSVGVAATIKHFPGIGDLTADTHHVLPQVDHTRERLEELELVPFKAGIDAGSKMVMSGHFAIPSLTGRTDVPATVSETVMNGLMREQLGFDGVIVTDAFDMKAISQGAGQIIEAIAAYRAQVDLLLLTKDRGTQERLAAGLELALSRGILSQNDVLRSLARISGLKRWATSTEQPDLSVVNSAEHQALAQELAERSITLVKDEANLLPINIAPDQEILAIMPQPIDLTPADTSSYVEPQLAAALREHHGNVREIIVPHHPTDADIAAVRHAASQADLVLVGTMSANMNQEQTNMANALLDSAKPTITLALRTPYDLDAYPDSETHLRTYSILRPSLDALAKVLFGKIEPRRES